MKRYKKYMTPYLSAFIIGPLLMLTEVFGEIMLPKLMSLIINNGVAERDIHYIMTIGAIMVLTTSVMAVGGNRRRLFLGQGIHLLYQRFKGGPVCQGTGVFL